jgi:uncharacterized membrane protein
MEARTSIIHVLHWAALGLETTGVIVIVLGAVAATLLFFRKGFPGQWEAAFRSYRANLGRGILLGLEFLVAADIIGTVAITPTFESLGVLATIIAIRTVLSVALEVEIEGHWPWRRHVSEKCGSPRSD